jgi:hypothetical protein
MSMQPLTVVSNTLDHTQTLSSDSGHDTDKENYPTISQFFSDLYHNHPQRIALPNLTYSFKLQDLFTINEIAKFSED